MKKKEFPAETETVQPAPEARYPLEKLRSHCMALFGVTTSTFDGAVCGLSGEYTVSGMKSIITKWTDKEVR